jgi:hypothetical protein
MEDTVNVVFKSEVHPFESNPVNLSEVSDTFSVWRYLISLFQGNFSRYKVHFFLFILGVELSSFTIHNASLIERLLGLQRKSKLTKNSLIYLLWVLEAAIQISDVEQNLSKHDILVKGMKFYKKMDLYLKLWFLLGISRYPSLMSLLTQTTFKHVSSLDQSDLAFTRTLGFTQFAVYLHQNFSDISKTFNSRSSAVEGVKGEFVSKKKKGSFLPYDKNICSLCMKPRVNPTSISSGYAFCYLCINSWIDKKKSCPITKAPITSELRRLY